MALKLHIIHAKDFVRMTPEDELDFEKSREMLVKAVLSEEMSYELDVLVDFRQVKGKLSTTDIWYLAEELSKHENAFREKIAVLVNPDKFDKARFFELCSLNRGIEVKAFSSYEDAINWFFPSSDVQAEEPLSK
jgi:DNA polymerase III delta prime subunit